jgi:hypothetical protein
MARPNTARPAGALLTVAIGFGLSRREFRDFGAGRAG